MLIIPSIGDSLSPVTLGVAYIVAEILSPPGMWSVVDKRDQDPIRYNVWLAIQ
jgi:hypothetical protein